MKSNPSSSVYKSQDWAPEYEVITFIGDCLCKSKEGFSPLQFQINKL